MAAKAWPIIPTPSYKHCWMPDTVIQTPSCPLCTQYR